MLGVVDASVLQLFHATINVHLANHRFSCLEWEGEGVSLFRRFRCCRFVLFAQLGYRIGVRQRKTQETRDLPLRRYPLKEAFAGGGGFVLNHFKRKVFSGNVGKAHFAMADFSCGKALRIDSLLNQLAQVHLFIARLDVGCRYISNHAGNACKRRCCAGIGDQYVY